MLLKPRVLCLLVLALGLVVPLARTQDVKEDPVLERMRKDITYLASDECEGRGVGTKGLDKAADYIAAEFKKAGLKPGGVDGTYFQPFPFATNAQLDGDSTLVLQGPGDKKIALQQGSDFQVMGTSAGVKLSAPVVFVGYGVTARGIVYDDYADVDVKGKIVIALRRLPRWNDKAKPFDGANKDELAGLEMKQFRAQAAKAAAVILVNDASEAQDALIPFATMSRGIITVGIPFLQIRREFLNDMLRESTGKKLADIEKAIDENLKPQSVELKDWRFVMDIRVKRTESPVKNVIGYIDGKGPLANEIVVVGAHYDHLGYGGFGSLGGGVAKGKIHHGADDNGSGTTSVMELARRFAAAKNPEGRKMVFMTFTAEERGLIGSRHYCRVEPLFPLKDTAAMFNLDMVGRVNPRLLKIDAKSVSLSDENGNHAKKHDLADNCKFFRQTKTRDGNTKEEIKDGLDAEILQKIPAKGLSALVRTDAKTGKVIEITILDNPRLLALGMASSKGFEALINKHNPGFDVVKDNSVFGASDHYSFYQQKIPVIFFWTGTHPDYHRPTDTSDKINVPGMKRIADYAEKIIDDLRTMPTRPEFAGAGSTFTGGGPKGPRLGILPDYTFGGKGLRLEDVPKGGPADTAGLKKNDVIIEIAGKAIADVNAYSAVMASQKSGVAIDIKILRDGKEMTLKVTPK